MAGWSPLVFLIVGQNAVVARNRHGEWPADFNYDGDIYPDRWPVDEPVIVWAHGLPFIPVLADYHALAGSHLRKHMWLLTKIMSHAKITFHHNSQSNACWKCENIWKEWDRETRATPQVETSCEGNPDLLWPWWLSNGQFPENYGHGHQRGCWILQAHVVGGICHCRLELC
jgi:hypothetical protein